MIARDRIIFLILAALLLFPSGVFPKEKANLELSTEIRTEIVEVFLNKERKGDFFILIKGDDILFTPKDFESFDFKEIPEGVFIEGERYISLKLLYPSVSFELDEKRFILDITVKPELLKTRTIDLVPKRPYEVLYPKENAAFLNYALTYSAGEDFDFQVLNIPFETGIRLGDYLTYSNFSYKKTKLDKRLLRLMSNLIWDERKTMIRVTVGDFLVSSGPLGGVGNLGGLKVAKEFLIDPYFIRYPAAKLSGYLQTPSELELYVDGLLIRKEKLSPGGFELLNIPLTTGLHDVELLIRDVYRREKRLRLPLYFTPRLLKPGLHEYSYGAGFKRMDFGKESFSYGSPAFLGYHRFGLTDTLTIGLRGELDREIVNVGPTVTFLIGRLGVFEAVSAISYSGCRLGYAGSIEYSYGERRFGIGILLKALSREYSNLSLAPIMDRPRFEGVLSVGYHLKGIGPLSISFSAMDRYYGLDTKRLSTFFSRKLFKDLDLSVRASTERQGNKTINEVFAGVSFYLGKDKTGCISFQLRGDDFRGTTQFHKNPPPGEGSGYRFLVEKAEVRNMKEDFSGSANLQYRGRYGIYSAGYSRRADEDSYNFTLSGGIGIIDKSLYLSRPITDNFALVKVADLKDVTVYLNHLELGKTDRKGRFFAPALTSYHDNKLSIEDRDIPIEYVVKEVERHVSPPLRGAAVVKFDVRKIQALTGRIFLIKDGMELLPEFGRLIIFVDERAIEGIIGKGGEFYVEDVKPGRFKAALIYKEMECRFDITIPENIEAVIDVGKITCEMD